MRGARRFRRSVAADVVGICIGCGFVASVATKLHSPHEVVNDIAATLAGSGRYLSMSAIVLLARAAVAAEMIVGVLLLSRSTRRTGAFSAIGLLAVYSAVLVAKFVAFGASADCGCLSWLGRSPVWFGLLRNLGIFCLLVVVLWPLRGDNRSQCAQGLAN